MRRDGLDAVVETAAGPTGVAGPPPLAKVTALATTPVKGLRLCSRSEVVLEPGGVPDDRCFYLVDTSDRMVNGKQIGSLSAVAARFDADAKQLTLTFPDGAELSDMVELGEALETRFFSRILTARVVRGPWSEALSTYTGIELRLVRAHPSHGAVDRGRAGAVTLISEASLARLEAEAEGRSIDPRRFRMLLQVAGPEAHEEDTWVGRELRVGTARLRIGGHVGRCVVTTRDPDTGLVDLATLKLLGYRRHLATSEELAFGVYGAVAQPGRVRVGDEVELAP